MGRVHAQTLSRLCYNTNKNKKGFRSRPMCPKPFISAVSPIFCSFPLYQLSEFHFMGIFHPHPFLLRAFYLLPSHRIQLRLKLYHGSGILFIPDDILHLTGSPVTFPALILPLPCASGFASLWYSVPSISTLPSLMLS